MIQVLRADQNESREESNKTEGSIHIASAARRGKESLKLGYSLSQVVHGYGALCQAITQYVEEKSDKPMTAREFNRLNFCLDVAIAEAVTEFDRVQRENSKHNEVERLGDLAHELRNALNNAVIATRMIKTGQVGIGGNTAQILDDSHLRMRDIIDRSLAEVRLQTEPKVEFLKCRISNLVSDVEITASVEASAKLISLRVDAATDLEILADRHLMISALSNLVQNAIKFTKSGGSIWIRVKAEGERVLIEIEDECGGLPPGKAEELFKPFTQKGTDKSGLGLGLTISRRAIELNNGSLSVRDIPHQGCVFVIDLPLA